MGIMSFDERQGYSEDWIGDFVCLFGGCGYQ